MKTWYILLGALTFPALLHAEKYSLQQCVEKALASNANLRNARLEIDAAAEDKNEAFSKFFPEVSATGDAFVGAKDLMRGEMEVPMMGSMPLSMIKKGVVANITAMQPIYAGGQVLNGNKLAALQHEVRQLQYAMTEKDVRQNVQDYYWRLVSLRGNVSTLDAVDSQLNEVHRQTTQFVEAGVINRNDLLRVEMKQQEMKSQRLTLENGIELVRMLLAQLCGADMQTFDIVEESILNPPAPATYFVAASEAVANREETSLTQQSVRANSLQIKMQRGKNLPTVAVGAAGMYYNVMEKNQGNLVGLATVSVPISDWWSNRGTKKAKIALQQSQITQADTQEKLHIDVLNAWNNLQEAYTQIEIARSSVAQADENLRLSRNQYDAGTLSMTDLLDAMTLYTQSHNRLTEACANYQGRVAEYERKTK
ncbi:MAG: TolC family protein [Bacteroidaceae bacterium]|nr:TolC family protein [Bacteroidaceae bacterium]